VHGVGERQPANPVQTRGNQRLAVQDGRAEVGGDDVVFAALRGDGDGDFPAFGFAKAVLPAGIKGGF
jgi:hypothetical protein